MADEEIAVPVTLDPPASEPVAEKEVPVELEDVTPEELLADDDAEDGVDELEFGFKKYQVPKSLKTAVEDWRAATTQKEQTVSERAKELDQRSAQIDQQSAATEDELRSRAIVLDIDSKLEGYKNVDWVTLSREDPSAYLQHKAYVDTLNQAKTEAASRLTELQTTRTQEAQRSVAKRIEETRQFAQTQIKGWTPELDAKLQQFVATKGIPQDVVARNMSPKFYELVHLAYVGEQLMKRQAAAPKTPAAVTPAAITPLQTVSAKAAPATRKSLAEMAAAGDMEGYAAARRAGRTR